ncbi:MAG: hypothetical protein IT330_06775 [Anaerolineae bacterium]|nr:hypothetical protein [Anaerolineae bacterium]
MVTNSFSHLLPNLFIGLCAGSPHLRPYSERFGHELAYQVFKFEVRFSMSAGGQANPDAVIASKKVANTFLLEWTESASISDDKKAQLERYSRVSARDLTDIIAVPPAATRTHDVAVIVRAAAADSFRRWLVDRQWRFPLMVFDPQEGRYTLKKVEFGFQEKRTEDFFAAGINVERIPLSYLPFPLDQVSRASIVAPTIRHLIALVIRGIQQIGIEGFCSGYVPAWSFIADRKQGELMRATKEVLNALGRKPGCKDLLERVQGDPPKWRLATRDVFRKRAQFYRDRLNIFISEHEGEDFQPELPFDETGD